MRRNGRVGLSVVDSANPDDMLLKRRHVVGVRPDSPLPSHGPISIKNTSARFSQPRSTPRSFSGTGSGHSLNQRRGTLPYTTGIRAHADSKDTIFPCPHAPESSVHTAFPE